MKLCFYGPQFCNFIISAFLVFCLCVNWHFSFMFLRINYISFAGLRIYFSVEAGISVFVDHSLAISLIYLFCLFFPLRLTMFLKDIFIISFFGLLYEVWELPCLYFQMFFFPDDYNCPFSVAEYININLTIVLFMKFETALFILYCFSFFLMMMITIGFFSSE